RLGVARIPVITEKKKTDTDTGFYDFAKDRMVLTEAGMKDGTFFAVISEVINSCRYKYQQEFTEGMRELEKKGKYAKKIPDFLETYKVAEAERKYEKGEISREEYTDVIYEDAARWRKDEAAYLKKEFGWK
ncbi:MAG: hypothetical protein IJ733_02670, partial [Lachnospiraceae bacterium]|nr:hypothetical protein [Lachnospiraceae bacterium]